MGTKRQNSLWARPTADFIPAFLFSIIAMLFFSAASEVWAGGKNQDRPIGANPDTYKYVHDAIGFYSQDPHWIHKNSVKLSDADALRRLAAGRLELISVFADEKTKSRLLGEVETKTTEYLVGYRAVYAVVPAHRKLKRLTFSQLGDILSGKITKWEQLHAGQGDIYVEADKVALGILATTTKTTPPKTFDKKRWRIEDRPEILSIRTAVGGQRVHKRMQKLTTPPKENMIRENNILIFTARGDPLGENNRQYADLIRFVPVAREAAGTAVPPTLEEIRKQNYPLMQTWRLIVRRGASKRIVGYAKLCQRAYDGNLCNLNYVKSWLIQPAVTESNAIRIPRGQWYFVMPELIDAYTRGCKSIKVIQVWHDVPDFFNVFLRGDCDLLDLAGSL